MVSVEAEAGPLDFSAWQRKAFGELKVVARACPLCADANEAAPASAYSLGTWTIKTCRGCGMTYMTSAPDYGALFEQMSWEKSYDLTNEWRKATQRIQQTVSKKLRWRLHLLPRRRMAPYLVRFAEPGNVVDLGCGGGTQLAELADEFVPHGIEISKAAAAKADALFRARGGYAVAAPCLEGLRQFPDGYFAAATLRSYLEHELRPAEVLKELHRTLKPGAVAIVKVPNYGCLNRRVLGKRWSGFRYPDHLNYFTPATLREMARRAGFTTWFAPTWRLPTGDNMWALLRKQ